MNADYEDITSRIEEKPQWWDANGVPRYGEFEPDMCPDIYSAHIALLRITCQACGKPFDVEMHLDVIASLKKEFAPTAWHYGDPPRHGCVGDTMNCMDIECLQAWVRDGGEYKFDWARHHDLEGKMADWEEVASKS